MRLVLLLLLAPEVLMLLPPRELCTEPFEVSSRQVSPVGWDAPVDWEFDQPGMRIMAAPNSSAFVQALDPVTGEQVDAPVLAATGLVRNWPALGIPTLGNGPEWGYSLRGSELYFMRAYGTSSRQLFKSFRTVTGAWSAVPLPGGVDRGLPWPSKDPSDSTPRLVYAVFPRTGVQTVLPYDVATRLVPEDPATERIIPVPVIAKVGGPRWIPGQDRVVFTMLGPAGQEQIALFDASTGAVEQVTSSPNLSIDETWASVYPDGSLVVWAVRDGDEFAFWEKGVSGWSEVSWVNPAGVLARPAKPFILSPEPFTYDGRPYIVFQLAASPGTAWQPSDFWIAELSAVDPCHFRMIAPESPLARRKPEALELACRLAIYWMEQDTAGQHAIFQAESGL